MNKAEAVTRFENGEVRVTEWRFAASAETGWHRHDYDYVIVRHIAHRCWRGGIHRRIEARRRLLSQGRRAAQRH